MERQCPNCLTDLKFDGQMGGLTYLCINCGQRSVDMRQLKNSLVAPHWKDIFSRRRHLKKSLKKNCKAEGCQLQAFNYEVPDGKDVEVDICFKCHQIWFDHKETDVVEQVENVTIDTELPKSLEKEVGKIQMKDGEAVPRHTSFKFYWSDVSIRFVNKSFKLHGARALLGLFGVPLENQNRLHGKPWINWALLMAVFVISVGAFFSGMPAYQLLAFKSTDPLFNGGANAITAFFLHADWGHLLGNLYMLYVFGDNVEDFLGGMKYVLLLVLGTVVGTILHMILTPNPDLMLVGASTGISAVVAYYALTFPGAKFSVLFGLLFWVRFPVMFYVVFWVGLQFMGLLNPSKEMAAVSFGGHLGGAALGIIFWLWPKVFKPRKSDYSFTRP